MSKLFVRLASLGVGLGFGMGVAAGSPQQSRADGAALTQEQLKQLVGYKAVDDYVRSGMKVSQSVYVIM